MLLRHADSTRSYCARSVCGGSCSEWSSNITGNADTPCIPGGTTVVGIRGSPTAMEMSGLPPDGNGGKGLFRLGPMTEPACHSPPNTDTECSCSGEIPVPCSRSAMANGSPAGQAANNSGGTVTVTPLGSCAGRNHAHRVSPGTRRMERGSHCEDGVRCEKLTCKEMAAHKRVVIQVPPGIKNRNQFIL